MFAERLLRATEVTTQAPSGFSQAITLELLNTWGQDGYLKWLSNLKDSYTKRRNWMVS
jgi:aromatic amino acid aminotransferase I